MRPALCHYSLHRSVAEGMDVPEFCRWAVEHGVKAVDFHERLIGSGTGPEAVRSAAGEAGLDISCFSLSTNFNVTQEELEEQLARAKANLDFAAALEVEHVRIFGGSTGGKPATEEDIRMVGGAIERLLPEAESRKIVMCVENHGGVPGTSEDVLSLIKRFDSPWLRACCDIGNFVPCGEAPVPACRAVAAVTGYAHVKDFKRTADGTPKAATIGEGYVDGKACLEALSDGGFDGYVALEFAGPGDEKAEAAKSWKAMVGWITELG